MKPSLRDWLIAIGYVILIYATLEVARAPLAFLRAHGWLRISLGITFSLAALSVIGLMAKRHPKSLWRYAVLIGIGYLYYYFASSLHSPEEQVHFIQYGLAGLFFLRALQHSIASSWKCWVGAFLLASGAGWLDEILQGMSPNRHYDPNDIKLNAISAGLGLIVFFLLRRSPIHSPNPTNDPTRQ